MVEICVCPCYYSSSYCQFSVDNCSFWQAAELLRHPHLQPYVEKIHLQTRNPRCNGISDIWDDADSTCIDKATIPEAEEDEIDPSISDAELGSFYPDDRIKPTLSDLERRLAKLKAQDPFKRTIASKPVPSKASDVTRNSRLTRAKTFGTSKRRSEPSRNQEAVRFDVCTSSISVNLVVSRILCCFWLMGYHTILPELSLDKLCSYHQSCIYFWHFPWTYHSQVYYYLLYAEFLGNQYSAYSAWNVVISSNLLPEDCLFSFSFFVFNNCSLHQELLWNDLSLQTALAEHLCRWQLDLQCMNHLRDQLWIS